MAVLTHDQQYPCVFELALLEWERYGDDTEAADSETTGLGAPFTLWVKYRMGLKIGDKVLYESCGGTTLVLEDIRRLIGDLMELAGGNKDRMGFDPIEPDFGLSIRPLTESDATVMISSVADPPAMQGPSASLALGKRAGTSGQGSEQRCRRAL